MKCPSCHDAVADDAAICPNCDHILDPSLFDAEAPQAAGEVTGRRAAPRPEGKRSGVRVGGKAQQKKKRPKPKAGAASDPKDWRSKISKEDWDTGAPARAAPSASEDNLRPLNPDDMLNETKNFVLGLSVPDKLAFFGAIGVAVGCFFPWKETVKEGEVLGLMSTGAVAFALAILTVVAIARRARVQRASPFLWWVLQLGSVGGSVFWCITYSIAAWNSTPARAPIGNMEVWVSKPSFGVILSFVSACVAGVGTLTGFNSKGDR